MHPFRVALWNFFTPQQPLQLLQAAASTLNVVGNDDGAGLCHGQGEVIGTALTGHIGEKVDDRIDPTFA
ncbi:hypothetical protein D3C87_1845480 [compost metagenome]